MEILSHNNRLDYGRSLIPEDGWETSWAIGTTYSLDLEVLMSVPLSLFHSKYLSESTNENNLRTDMLDSLDKVKDKMFVFVHENNITSRCGYSMLMGFLDQNIWNVPLDSPNKNFHPKVWLIRYTLKNGNGKSATGTNFKYRLITMSRNITAATDFDIAVTMDSYQTEKEVAENSSLAIMMTKLMERTGRKDIIKQFTKELKHVRFIPPYPFDRKGKTAIFWPHVFGQLKSPLLQDKEYEELLVISPFIDDNTLNMLCSRCNKTRPILISREYEMDRCSPETLNKWDCYMWNSMLEEASNYEEDEIGNNSIISHSISLHAKMFIAKFRFDGDRYSYNNWFIGSTNCTQAGLRSNYEAQVQLRSLEQGTSAKEVLNSLLNPDAPLITSYKVKEQSVIDLEEEKNRQIQRELIFNLSNLDFKGTIIKEENGKYAMDIHTDVVAWGDFCQKYPDVDISLKLFSSDMDDWNLRQESRHKFICQMCQQLSSFIRVRICFTSDEEKNFLIQLPVQIPEERHGKIMSEILDNEEKLMRYLMFCLDAQTDNEQQNIGKQLKEMHHSDHDNTACKHYSLPIYEKLLLATSRNKSALKNIRDNVEKLRKVKDKNGKPLLSKEFINMWNLFAPYAK